MHLRISLLLLILTSSFSMAETLQDKLLSCAQNSDSLQRLVCFDKLATSLKVQDVKTEVTQPPKSNKTLVIKPAEPAIKAEKQEAPALARFGNENKQAPGELIEEIDATVTKITKSAYGQYIISLENQQVWRQTDKTRLRISKGQTVTIKRGALGSFFMGVKHLNKRIRVKRVK